MVNALGRVNEQKQDEELNEVERGRDADKGSGLTALFRCTWIVSVRSLCSCRLHRNAGWHAVHGMLVSVLWSLVLRFVGLGPSI